MNRIPEHNWRAGLMMRPAVSDLDELGGWLGLGAKREALRLARGKLKAGRINAADFGSSLNAMLTLADRLKPWAPLVEAAYARLPKRGRSTVRFWMLSFYGSAHNYEAASRFIPRRFAGELRLVDLAVALEMLLALGRMDEVKRLARRLPHAIEEAGCPGMRMHLLLCLAEVRARMGKWDEALAAAQLAQDCGEFDRTSVINIVEIYVAKALRALQHGLRLFERCSRNSNPEVEIMVPGNDRAIQEEAAKQFRGLQRILERIVPKERQKELGLTCV